jgi:RimJ/RimL family protein N-acetyltransferase
VEEGRQREHVWLDGRYVDNVLMGVMREEWRG